MQHRKRTGFGQHWVKGRRFFGQDLVWRVVLNHHEQFKRLEDVLPSDKSELTAETIQRFVTLFIDRNIKLQWFERPVGVNREAFAQSCQPVIYLKISSVKIKWRQSQFTHHLSSNLQSCCHLDQLIKHKEISASQIELGLLNATEIDDWITCVQSCRVQEGCEAFISFEYT